MSGIECGSGCCPGCEKCFGSGIGCHRNPCICRPIAPYTDEALYGRTNPKENP